MLSNGGQKYHEVAFEISTTLSFRQIFLNIHRKHSDRSMKSFAIPKEFWPHCLSRRLIRCFVCLEPPVRSQVRERQQQQTLWNRGPFSRLFFLLQRTSRVCLTHVKEVRVPSMPQSKTWKRIQITVSWSWQLPLTSYDLNSWCFLFFSEENINCVLWYKKNQLKNYFVDLNLKEILEFTIPSGEFLCKQSFSTTKIVDLIYIG